ncbi:hypothetical protein K488DRAFT_87703 [Vararia minispora EC-137]|uniref:Uncharacterized protein n=1 Tax=Vararia minispora EC-137 TaxID=1314806 RepID=A0ACB8QG00_9AGAM|nr:hypothetical protein K488DRAFT_87703 [Vararia minispora EC-137]
MLAEWLRPPDGGAAQRREVWRRPQRRCELWGGVRRKPWTTRLSRPLEQAVAHRVNRRPDPPIAPMLDDPKRQCWRPNGGIPLYAVSSGAQDDSARAAHHGTPDPPAWLATSLRAWPRPIPIYASTSLFPAFLSLSSYYIPSRARPSNMRCFLVPGCITSRPHTYLAPWISSPPCADPAVEDLWARMPTRQRPAPTGGLAHTLALRAALCILRTSTQQLSGSARTPADDDRRCPSVYLRPRSLAPAIGVPSLRSSALALGRERAGARADDAVDAARDWTSTRRRGRSARAPAVPSSRAGDRGPDSDVGAPPRPKSAHAPGRSARGQSMASTLPVSARHSGQMSSALYPQPT